MIPTPRTDAEEECEGFGIEKVPAEFARTLERELAAALEARNAAVRRCAEICMQAIEGDEEPTECGIRIVVIESMICAEFPEAFK